VIDTDALEGVIKAQFEDTDGIADAQIMIFDTIDNANKAEDVIDTNSRSKNMTTLMQLQVMKLQLHSLHCTLKMTVYSATVLKGTITNKPEEKTGIDLTKATV
jgi:hypothetical protein